jgi:uncharacterized protein (TIGR01244 family)
MRPIALSDEIAVGEVPQAAEIVILSQAGFRALLNVQPDGEVARFADGAVTKLAVEALGMAYAHVPLESRLPPEDQINRFAEAFARLPRPVYAYCYSGGRAAAAWALAVAPKTPPPQIVMALEAAGYDAGALRGALERRHVGLPAFEITAPAVAVPIPHAMTEPALPVLPLPQVAIVQPMIIVMPRPASDGGFSMPG